MFTVGDLKAILAKFPDDMPVGRLGHYGEFHEMGQHDFRRQDGIVATAPYPGGFESVEPSFSAFVIDPPDIGPEPD